MKQGQCFFLHPIFSLTKPDRGLILFDFPARYRLYSFWAQSRLNGMYNEQTIYGKQLKIKYTRNSDRSYERPLKTKKGSHPINNRIHSIPLVGLEAIMYFLGFSNNIFLWSGQLSCSHFISNHLSILFFLFDEKMGFIIDSI